MPRLMSVALTEQAVRDRRKTVTRRLGWKAATPGMELDLCRKVMGRRRPDGTVEPLVRIARVRVLGTRWEPLRDVTAEDVRREGFTEADWTRAPYGNGLPFGGGPVNWFLVFFARHMNATPFTEVNRIEWEYLPTPTDWPTP